MKKQLLIIFICVLVPFSAAFAQYKIQVGIPNSGIAKGASQISIASYVGDVYKFSLLIVGIVALLAFVVGAIEFTVSAGFVSRRGDAKDRMMQALFGLLLLVGAALIFNTINDDITNLNDPNVTSVTGGT